MFHMSQEYVSFVLSLFFLGLVSMVILDILTGLAKGVVNKDVNSPKNFKGYWKKALILTVPIAAFVIDVLVNQTFDLLDYDTFLIGSFNIIDKPVLAIFFLVWFILGEILSIIENLGNCGVPLPRFIKERLSQIHDSLDDGEKPSLIKKKKEDEK